MRLSWLSVLTVLTIGSGCSDGGEVWNISEDANVADLARRAYEMDVEVEPDRIRACFQVDSPARPSLGTGCPRMTSDVVATANGAPGELRFAGRGFCDEESGCLCEGPCFEWPVMATSPLTIELTDDSDTITAGFEGVFFPVAEFEFVTPQPLAVGQTVRFEWSPSEAEIFGARVRYYQLPGFTNEWYASTPTSPELTLGETFLEINLPRTIETGTLSVGLALASIDTTGCDIPSGGGDSCRLSPFAGGSAEITVSAAP